MTALVILEDGKIISSQTARNSKEKSTRTTRELDAGGNLIYTLTIQGVEGVVCVQKFQRI